MANLITHALSFSQESVSQYFVKPLFVNSDIKEICEVHLDVKNSKKLDLIDALENITKAYAQGTGFTPSSGITITQRTLSVVTMKSEVEQSGRAFRSYVKEAALKKNVLEGDISDTIFEEIVMAIYYQGLKRDLQRQIFFADDQKTTLSGGIPTATADVNYNAYEGFFKVIEEAITAGTIPAAQVVDLNTSTYQTVVAVKQKDTATLTGTSGTANITINGTAYLATFATSLTVTAANFVTSHAAAILAKYGNLVVTSSAATIIVEAGIAGVAQSVSAPVNVSGDLAGSVAATTANVVNTTLKTDAALTAFKALYGAAKAEMFNYPVGELRFVVSRSMEENYMSTIEALNGSDEAYRILFEGRKVLAYRGVPIIARAEWDQHIAAEFTGNRPHRALFVLPKNLVVGVDGSADELEVKSFYDETNEKRVFRTQYNIGVNFVHPNYIAYAR